MNKSEPVYAPKEEWDYLIILDACRYDFFDELYRDYLNGTLYKKCSPGSCTDEWREKSFPDYYENIIYLSANPQISMSPVYGYCAGDHFSEVVEIWKDGWQSEIGTVFPETVTDAAIQYISKNPTSGKRIIVHYMQPHAPYLCLGQGSKGYRFADINSPREIEGVDKRVPFLNFKKTLYGLLFSIFKSNSLLGNHPDWVLRKSLGLPPQAPMEYVLRNSGVDKLRQAYKDNLGKVLKEVARLLKFLSGKIVITSDHGEFLGEKKCFSHPCNVDHKILREVPWLEISKDSADLIQEQRIQTNRESDNCGGDLTEEEVVQRLRALGYLD